MPFMFEDEVYPSEKATNKEKFLVLVIYDIIDDKKRQKVAKVLKSYGYRIQKSAFECYVDEKNFKKLKEEVLGLVESDDLVSIYKLNKMVEITKHGHGSCDVFEDEDFLFF